MADTDWSYGSQDSGTPGNGGAGTAWTDLTNVLVSDDAYAVCALPSAASSQRLEITDWGFAVDAGDTVNGVVVQVERKASAAVAIKDLLVQLIVGGVLSGDNKASATEWSIADTIVTYGSTTDVWTATLSPAVVNAANFGIAVSCTNLILAARTASIDWIGVTIYTTHAWSPNGSDTLYSYRTRLHAVVDGQRQRAFT